MPDSYPSFPQCDGTHLEIRSGVMIRIATSGFIRTRILSSYEHYDPVVVHRGLSITDWVTLKTFYNTHRAIAFTLVYRAGESASGPVNINCVFREKPFDINPQLAVPPFQNITVYMMQT